MLAGVAQGIDDARAASGIESRMIVTAVRNFGTERAEWVARTAARAAAPVRHRLRPGRRRGRLPARRRSRAPSSSPTTAGLGLTCHAGEWAGPESVRGALALPGPVTRLGHGVRAVEDPALVAELAERGTVLEVCPTSNVVLGAYPDYAAHPFPVLRDAGVRVTLGSDDPPYWERHDRRRVRGRPARRGDSTTPRCATVTRTAVEAAFVPAALRSSLLARIQQ